MPDKLRAAGLCLGAENIKAIVLSKDTQGIRIEQKIVRSHQSNPRSVFRKVLEDIGQVDFATLTGRKFRTIVNGPAITEPEATEHALDYLSRRQGMKGFSALASLGAENFMVYQLNPDGSIATVESGNKCASGTGEFFLQQIGRMNISVDQAVDLAENSQAHRVSGRCSVFCKSDCTHALNIGVPIGEVTAGLCSMIADKVLDLLAKSELSNIIAVGSVTRNRVITSLLRKRLGGLYVPEHADAFEAIGAAMYALKNEIVWQRDGEDLFKTEKKSFDFLSPIANAKKLVRFETLHEQKAEAGDECIVGLDVGSTTTKAVVIRTRDDALLASVYGRTNGNPVQASRECYRELASQIEEPVKIIGLGTTGSGRQIAGLHAQTDSVINEIIAHATAAAHFDKEVDTIFEIGGQDAKYTHLTNGVPSDYAMNEACSAGTGSFLEESAKESLGLDYREIENVALRGKTPPNFNDQCAAFISSDIKTAIHEGIDRDDIVAGLVYSICLNYVNRVKGQRNTGNRVFMQGGVCYNKAVPLAMANLLEKEIVVPPHPGLMGAYGVALEVKQRIELGHTPRSSFDLGALADQQVQFGKHFRCAGGKEKCDRNCQIAVLKINGKSFPFGGACNKYYNQIHHVKHDPERFDYVRRRQQLLFETYFSTGPESEKTVGIPRSYLTNMLLPLWSRFFAECGFKVVLSDRVDPEGIKRTRTSLCYPGEIAHGCFANLLHKKPDAIFLPKILELHVENSVSKRREHQTTCMLLQSEPYYVPCAFKGLTDGVKILTPGFDFSRGWEMQEDEFIELGAMLGVDSGTSRRACSAAVKQLKEFFSSLKKLGQEALTTLERNKDASAVVLFGRPYNAFAPEANMGIPAKFATRGELVIPWDLLPFEDQPCDKSMNWAIGQNLMKTAHYVFKHPQLFATWITNFSCGPDSFLVGYFRDIMEDKPSLTLELDSHTADAGVNTRIEAFMDVVSKWRQIPRERTKKRPFVQAHITYEKDKPVLVSSQNTKHTLYDPNVHVLFPSMGRVTSELAAAAFRGIGIRASSVPVYDYEALKLGRANTSCKECLPLQLVTGGLMKYIKHRSGDDELVAYFMPTCGGNCRFTQYNVFLRKLIEKKRLENIALLTLTNENGYAGLSPVDAFKVLKSFIIADVMTDIRNSLDVLALDRSKAQHIFNKQLNRIIHSFSEEKAKNIYSVLEDVAKTLAQIPRRFSIEEAKKVSLMGEIFVRRDCFSSRELRERLARRDIIVRQAHILEWLSYCDHNVKEGIYQSDFSIKSHLEFSIKQVMQRYYEKKIKRILSRSQLYEFEMVDMKKIMEYGGKFFDRRFTGEVILFAGNYFKDIMHSIHGAVSIGPFACMPTRVTEAVMAVESTIERKKEITKAVDNHADDLVRLPFLSLEMDGNPLPQVLEARIEAFALQVERLHQRMNA